MPLSALRLPDPDPTPQANPALLAALRVHWARCRCLPRTAFFAQPPTTQRTVEAMTVALLRALDCPEALGALRLYQPGATELSFDEKWLLGALSAGGAGDLDSLTFLLNSRLTRTARRQIGMQIIALSRAL